MKTIRGVCILAAALAGCLPQPDPPPRPPPVYASAAPSYPPAPDVAQPRPLQPATPQTDPYGPARQRCLDETNAYRARVGAPPLTARPDKAACSDTDARGDALNGTVHGGSGRCGFDAQNECPRWDSPAAGMVGSCLASMFREGPGEPYQAHGHYINMTGTEYHSLACGFHETSDGHVWLVQNYFR